MPPHVESFCNAFEMAPVHRRFLFGANPYAEMLTEHYEVAAIVDDFTTATRFAGVPVIRTSDVPSNGLVVACLLGKPQTAEQILAQYPFEHLDFFAFHRGSSAPLPSVRFWGDFVTEYQQHRGYYDDLAERFADEPSRETWRSIFQFRLSGDITHLANFSERQDEQYFEPFLDFGDAGEVFADVGSFDGHTSAQFARYCPGYDEIHVFEPSASNMVSTRERLSSLQRVVFHQIGLSDTKGEVHFSSSGSTSLIVENGDEVISTDKLDDVVSGAISYLKIDIEGEELAALHGARDTIAQHHPRIAVCVYHRTEDFRILPEFILSIRDDYDLYLRHYTEGVVETVMYFLPAAS